MTQGEKKLVIKDLCGRLPYGVIIQINDGLKGTYDSQLVQVFCDRVSCSVSARNPLKECICIDSVKPYLRPMSSMTEEEQNEYYKTFKAEPYGSGIGFIYVESAKSFDWLNAHHFDYRGLIEKGLAISTEVFNPYKN